MVKIYLVKLNKILLNKILLIISMVLPSQITTTSNDIGNINNILDEYTDTYHVNSSNNMIRCPEGYVFEHSNLLFGGVDRSVIEYNTETDKWINNDNNQVDWSPVSGTIRCKRKFCEPLGPVNSEQEYNVIVDDINDNSNEVTCNGGYVFDTTDTRIGKVKCGAIPIMTNNSLDNKINKVGWLVDNRHHELFCEGLNENDCDMVRIPVSISNDTGKIFDENGKYVRCTWIPPIDDTTRANSEEGTGFIRSEGQCKFIHRADLNDTDPICRGMYCNRKEIPNSNRTVTGAGPLPGPESGSIHGDCINFDGQIIDNITNSSDCACFQHKSCDMCTNNENCQWCGSNDTGGGFCYSTKTHLSICNNSIRHDRGGTCIHVKTTRPKTEILKPEDGWTKDSCENSVCVNQNHWNQLNEMNYETDKNNPELYKDNITGPDDCRYDNNFWDYAAIIEQSDTCIAKNTRLDNIQRYKYYPIEKEDGRIKFNISDYICVPYDNNISYDKIQDCDNKNKQECELPGSGCQYIENDLRDSIYNWSDLKHIEFNGNDTCPINNVQTMGNKFSITTEVGDEKGYIVLNDSSSVNDADLSQGNYYNTCSIINSTKEKNILTDITCGIIGGPSNNTIHYCEEPNVKYCSIDDTVDGDPVCPSGSSFDLNGNTIPGCIYYNEHIDILPDNYRCFGDNIDYKCSSPDTDYYNCEKHLLGSNKEGECSTTEYNVIGTDMNLINPLEIITNVDDGIRDNIKPYLICDTSKGGDNLINSRDRCNLIGDEYAHWGNLCTDISGNKYPVKHICKLHPNATWGKYIHDTDFGWGCYKDDGTMYSDENVCGLILQDASNELKIIPTPIINSNRIIQIGGFPITPVDPSVTDISNIDPIIIEQINSSGTARGQIISIEGNLTNIQSLIFQTTYGEFIDSEVNYNIKGLNGQLLGTITSRSPIFTVNPLTLDPGNSSCIIDGSPEGESFDNYKYMCENSSNHTIGFKYFQNSISTEQRGVCKNRRTREEILINGNVVGEDLCTSKNMIYINEYNYNNNNACGANSITNKPDIPTVWTGGEISSQDGIHISECSPSIMSNCNVSCNSGYGGGGDYVCLYNEEGGDICEKINNKPESTLMYKQELCESYPSCIYNESECRLKSDGKTDGHLEWIGAECYKLDNTAFSHGIADLPELDNIDYFRPFERVIYYLVIYICFSMVIIYISVKIGINLTGKVIDGIFNKSFESMNKIISVVTGADKILFDFVLSSEMDFNVKIGLTILTIGLFIGSYFLFKYIKTNIKEFTHDSDIYFNHLWSQLKYMKTIDIRSPDIHAPDLSGINIPDIRLGSSGNNNQDSGTTQDGGETSGDINVEDMETLTVIIQAVVTLIILMIIILVIKNSLD